MADQQTISRIAKILARATSANPGEADAAVTGAYKRMIRDRVTIKDLLTLPSVELYQEGLIKLVFVVLENQKDLTPPDRRKAIEKYMAMISARFADAADSGNSSDQRDPPRGEENGNNEGAKNTREDQHQQDQQAPAPKTTFVAPEVSSAGLGFYKFVFIVGTIIGLASIAGMSGISWALFWAPFLLFGLWMLLNDLGYSPYQLWSPREKKIGGLFMLLMVATVFVKCS